MRDFQIHSADTEIDMEGFQIVSGQLFSRQLEPSMTIWSRAIAFSTTCYHELNDCASIHIMVNSREKKIAILPCPARDKDAIAWLKSAERQKSRRIECSKFAGQLFDIWKLDEQLHYRANGRLVTSGNRVMLLFDFSAPEAWHGSKLVNGL